MPPPIARRAVLAGLAAVPAGAAAQPAEVSRIVASFPPGAALDGIARLLADAASRAGQGTVVVENRAGANGNIAAQAVARARPDGRTLLLAIDTTFSLNPHLYPELGFATADLEPVAIVGTYPVVLIVHPTAGVTDLAGFVAAARRAPLLYASAGNGSPGHLAMEHLRATLGLPRTALEHVPFRGNAQAMTDLLAGRVQAGFIAVSGGADFVRDGRLRALAISGPERLAMLSDVPTVAEQGHAGFDVRFAYVLLVPRGTPEAAKARWATVAADFIAAPENGGRLAGWAVSPQAGGPAEAVEWIARAHARWGEVARDSGMRIE